MCYFSAVGVISGTSLDYADMYLEYNDYLRQMKPIIKVLNPPAPHSPFSILRGPDGALWIVFKNEYGSVFHRLPKKKQNFLNRNKKYL